MRIRPAAAVILALMTGAAYAQDSLLGPTMPAEQLPQNRQLEKSYRDAIDKMPETKGATDPWGNVRPATAAKDQKSKQSTGVK